MNEPTPPPRCDHWIGAESRYCRKTEGVRRFVLGRRCQAHTPNAIKGLRETPPGPGWPIHRTSI